MRGRQLVSNIKATFRLRHRSGYVPTMSILFNGVRYGITNVNQIDGLNRYIELVCKS
jgi:SPP1 family predicted phage head-tail adaptor